MNLKASNAYRWVPCPGSVMLEDKYPSIPLDDGRLRGLEEHGLAAKLLSGEAVTVGPEVMEYINDVRAVTDKPYVETRLPLERDGIQLNCILDAYHYEAGKNRFYIWDYKAGYKPVSAVGNWQLLTYAMALLDKIPNLENSATFELRIVQPRIRTEADVWIIPAINLRSYRNILFDAAINAGSDNPKLQTGNHCSYCSALGYCTASIEAGWTAVGYQDYALDVKRPVNQLAHDLDIIDTALDYLKDMKKAIESQLLHALRGGKQVLGYEVGTGRPNMSWSQDVGVVKALESVYGVKLVKESLITPKQAIAAGVPKSVVNAYSSVSSGGIRLVKSDDENMIRRFRDAKV